jgi:PHP family Zn ribbon phosphoesterase
MTATIQEEPEHIEVKDLYFKSAVDVTAWNFRFEMQVTYTVEEAAANRWIVRMNPIRRKNNFKFWFEDYKSRTFKCAICKNDNPAVLQFHHLDPKKKKYNIPTMINQCMKVREIQAELKKCIAVCSNCHRLITDTSTPYEEVVEKEKEEYSR